jgi:uncharacterized protein (UPF0276 family)
MQASRPVTILTDPISVPAGLPKAGIGLRFQHHRDLLAERPQVGFVEVHSENYLGGGPAISHLEAARREYPVSLHGVGLSLGSAEGFNSGHLHRVRDLAARIDPLFVSEHISWSVSGGVYLNDLLPLPYTEEALAIFCTNLQRMQETLNREVLVENPSTYLRFAESTIPEWDFVAEISRRTGCGLLLDVNNIYVSACNHGFDAQAYLRAMPRAAVREIHLAGHTAKTIGERTLRIDDHGSAVADEVWSLYGEAIRLLGPVPTLIEWDSRISPLADIVAEAAKADAAVQQQQEQEHADAAAA